MRRSVMSCAVLFLCSVASPRGQRLASTEPIQFEIGRETHFDFGPPFNYYEVFVVRSATLGASIERITLTPPGDKCLVPAKLETAAGSINEPVAVLLGSTNPCTIPEKELQRELKRGRHKLVFTFANVVMQVQCGNQTRLLRSQILDRDMFDSAAQTPQHTSWTMQLLEHLERAVGPGVMEEPVFSVPPGEEFVPKVRDSETLRDLAAGEYDALFPGGQFRLSDLYKATQNRPSPPSVRLVSSVPTAPEAFVLPEYPPVARAQRVEGVVSVIVEVDTNGIASHLTIENCDPLLCPSVRKAVSAWRFPPEAISYEVKATIEFALNCP